MPQVLRQVLLDIVPRPEALAQAYGMASELCPIDLLPLRVIVQSADLEVTGVWTGKLDDP